MRKMKIGLGGALLVLAVALLCAWPGTVTAQTTEPPETEVTDPPSAELPAGDETGAQTPSTANPPAYIGELLTSGDLIQDQVDQMRTAGYGWGEIRLATLLARQIAADSGGTLVFADALTQVMDARTAGKGFGEIAADNNLKIGGLVGKRQAAGNAQKGSAALKGNKVQTRTQAQDVDGDEQVGPDPANPPTFIREMVQAQVATQEQVNTMLTAGYGWGEVRIAALMAQQMAANSNGALTFDAALAQIMEARTAGKGFGQIAAENNLKVGELVRNPKAGDAATGQGKKLGFFARIGRALGFGRSADKPEKTAAMTKSQASVKSMKGDKPERPTRPERAARAERPERPEKPAQLERPERPTRPERPERGPNR
jgi:hypothetical protein